MAEETNTGKKSIAIPVSSSTESFESFQPLLEGSLQPGPITEDLPLLDEESGSNLFSLADFTGNASNSDAEEMDSPHQSTVILTAEDQNNFDPLPFEPFSTEEPAAAPSELSLIDENAQNAPFEIQEYNMEPLPEPEGMVPEPTLLKADESLELPSIELPELELDVLKPTDEEDLSRSIFHNQTPEVPLKQTEEQASEPTPPEPLPVQEFQPVLIAPKEAAFPFTLVIEGFLEPYEKEKLLDILNQFQLGVREIDLIPQFESQKILLPRMSEYACIYIAQNLRDARVRFKMGPSDQIFKTQDTENELRIFKSKSQTQTFSHEDLKRASKIPLFQSATHPENKKIKVICSLSVSHSVYSPHESQVKRSDDYAEKLEALTQELQHKAFFKGADAILNFTVSLQPLQTPGHYKMLLLGVAIKTV